MKVHRNANGENIIARINLGRYVNHIFELAETPKGSLVARIDDDPITPSQLKELNQWLRMMTVQPTEKE